jgi:hypothetical protein
MGGVGRRIKVQDRPQAKNVRSYLKNKLKQKELAWPKRPKIVCSPSYVDIRSRANTTRGLNFEHMIKARAHKGGVRIGKTPKKLASICCP